MADIFQTSLDAIYSVLGTAAVITVNGIDYSVIVIDKTKDAEINALDGVDIDTVIPAAIARCSELTTVGLTKYELLIDSVINYKGKSWTIKSYREKETPLSSGELLLALNSHVVYNSSMDQINVGVEVCPTTD